jgi:hypothetical protein
MAFFRRKIFIFGMTFACVGKGQGVEMEHNWVCQTRGRQQFVYIINSFHIFRKTISLGLIIHHICEPTFLTFLFAYLFMDYLFFPDQC